MKRPIIISRHSSYSYGHADGKKHHQIDIDIELNHPLAMFGPIGVLAVAAIVYAVTGSWLVTASAALTASVLLVLLGIALRWRKRVVNQENENEQMESALADLRHGNQLAIELHDTLSNDLTYISTIARNNLAAPAGIDGGDWQRVLDRSQRAFAEVHGIIDFLTEQSGMDAGFRDESLPVGGTGTSEVATAESGQVDSPTKESALTRDPVGTGSCPAIANEVVDNAVPENAGGDDRTQSTAGMPQSFVTRVKAQITDTEEFLEAQGYRGTAAVNGIAMVVDPEAAAEALSLMTEIGTNIRRHAPAGADSYLLFVTLSPEWIEIRETNDIRDDADAQSGLSAQERSGRGLAMHRTHVQELGGELTTRSDDGTWMIYVRIPCVRG
ncbi:histidine kinase [Bifidobacterium longum subsp. suis]|uniref:histidine kinase n=2 Tax=Bifidobacterium longum TaxID=216816 RepID=A0A1S2VUH7_BIFLN|nr:histidine kinase [Bifidobacterium longum]OIN62377.1 histidine kinase [Bifidobacterium longum subsp. suis]